MAKTIVAVFDTAPAAQKAVSDLQQAGVPRDHVRITSNESATPAKSEEPGMSERVRSFFESLFADDSDRSQASTYAEAWRRGHYVVVADVNDNLSAKATEILNRSGTVDLDRRIEHWKKTGYTGQFDRSAAPYTAEQRAQEVAAYGEQKTEAIPVVQEELAVGKLVVQRGGVRIHSYTEERPVEEVVRLREERLTVERVPVNRAAERGDATFEERTVNVTAHGEEAVVEKRARVVEEVVVAKDVEQREETVRDTVRRKDVEVEHVEAKTAAPARPATRQDAPHH